MFKTLGILMVVLSVFAFTYSKAEDMKRRLENVKQLKRGLGIIKNEIMFSSREMGETAYELSKALDGEIAEIFGAVFEKMSADTHKSFGQAWSEEIEKCEKKPVSDTSLKIMNDFASMAGKMSKDIELENIEKSIELLDEETKEETENYTKNRKLIFSLGGISGISVLILFL